MRMAIVVESLKMKKNFTPEEKLTRSVKVNRLFFKGALNSLSSSIRRSFVSVEALPRKLITLPPQLFQLNEVEKTSSLFVAF